MKADLDMQISMLKAITVCLENYEMFQCMAYLHQSCL